MPHQPLPIPLYQRVFGILHQRLRDGRYAVGDQFDTEDELVAEFGVSKATIRQATGELVARNLLVRRQGRGTFVTAQATAESEHPFVGSLADLILGTHQLPLRDLKMEQNVAFPSTVRCALNMTDTHGTVIRRRREIDGQVFAYTIQYLAPGIEKLVTNKGLREYGLLTLLHRQGVVLAGAEQSTSAELADVEVAERLEVGLGAAVLFAERLLLSDQGPVEVVRGWYRGDLYQWRARFNFQWDGAGLVIYSDDRAGFAVPGDRRRDAPPP